MGAADSRQPKQPKASSSVESADALPGTDGSIAPPITMKVTVWLDRSPELDSGGLADYIAYAALYECIQPLEQELLTKHLVPTEDDEEGDD